MAKDRVIDETELWEYSLDGTNWYGEFGTQDEAEEDADQRWADEVEDSVEGMRNGEVFTSELYLRRLDQDGNIVEEIEKEVEYEYYHGDLEEHGTLWQELR